MFNSNDAPLNQEYRKRQERRAAQAHLAQKAQDNEYRSLLNYIRNTNIGSSVILIISIMFLLAFFIFNASSAEAQEGTAMDPGDGGSGGNLEMLYLRSALNKVQAGDYESARRYFEAALDLVSDLAPAYTSLAYLHLLEANYELALEDALIAYELNPADGSIYFVLGEIHFAMEDYAAAQSNYETYQLWVELAEAEPILIRQLLGEDSMDIVNEHLGMSIAKRSQEATS